MTSREQLTRKVERAIQSMHPNARVEFTLEEIKEMENALADAGYYQMYRDAWIDQADTIQRAKAVLRGEK